MVRFGDMVVSAVCLVVVGLLLASPAQADVIVQHLGDTDPTSTEGFTLTDTGITLGPIAADTDVDGTAAWTTDDNNNKFGFYTGIISAGDTTDALDGLGGSWIFTVKIRVVDINDATINGAVLAQIVFNGPDKRFSMNFGTDADGDAIVKMIDGQTYTTEGVGNSVYQTFQLVGNDSSTAALFIDGVEQIASTASGNISTSTSRLEFGSLSGGDVGQGNWAEVTFETNAVIPEPASVALLSLGGALMVMGRRR